MENKPYKKKLNTDGSISNPITKDKPYNNLAPNRKARRSKFKYIIVNNPVTGAFIGKVKPKGNNRKRNKRTGKVRHSI